MTGRFGIAAALACALILGAGGAAHAEPEPGSPSTSTAEADPVTASDAAPPVLVELAPPALGDRTPYVLGQSAPVSATVTVEGGPVAGTLEFFDGEVSLGSREIAGAELTATVTIETDRWPGSGARSITVVYTPEEGSPAIGAVSEPQTYRVVDTSRMIPDIELGDAPAAEISDASLEWTIANIWFSNFSVGFEREVLSGPVTLPELPIGTTIPEKQAYFFRPFTFSGGVGSRDEAGNRIVSYSGSVRLTSGTGNRWDFADPQLHIAANGDGYITAQFSGYYLLGERTIPYGPARVTIATFSGAAIESDGDGRVNASIPLNWEGQAGGAGTWAHDFDDSFPTEFVALLHPAISLFFARSGVATDASKIPHPIEVSFTERSADPVDPGHPVKPLPFTDVKKGQKFYTEINWLYQEGIATGVKQANGTVKFEPKWNITREATAAYMYRLAGKPAWSAPKVSPFADLKPSDKFYKEITWLADQGITTGVAQPSGKPWFEPKWNITREAMSAFVYRFEGKPKFTAPGTSPFADLKRGDKFYKEITWAVDAGVTTGIKQPSGKAKYEPKWNITREAMAAFLYRLDH